jgi:hypothetical protein
MRFNRFSTSNILFAGLLAALILLRIIFALLPAQKILPSQESLLTWSAVLTIIPLALVGNFLARRTGFPRIWDTTIETWKRLGISALTGLGLGLVWILLETGSAFDIILPTLSTNELHTPLPPPSSPIPPGPSSWKSPCASLLSPPPLAHLKPSVRWPVAAGDFLACRYISRLHRAVGPGRTGFAVRRLLPLCRNPVWGQLPRQTVRLFLQAAPENVHLPAVKQQILNLESVQGVHHTHIWSLDGEHHVLSAHIVVPPETSKETASNLKRRLANQIEMDNIEHMTIEIEFGEDDCRLALERELKTA